MVICQATVEVRILFPEVDGIKDIANARFLMRLFLASYNDERDRFESPFSRSEASMRKVISRTAQIRICVACML